MCPKLSRPHYFLTVLNLGGDAERDREGLERQLYEVLLELAEAVRVGNEIGEETAGRVNGVFREYRAVQLRLDVIPGTAGARAGLRLGAEFADGQDDCKRMYMEAIVSLLEALEKGDLELRHCEQCGQWFIPYSRAGVAKFCGTRCRNRYHYEQRRGEREEGSRERDYAQVQ